MGRARIVANKGAGLYTATPLYNWTRLDAVLSDLTAQQANYATLLLRALNTLDDLRDEVAVAGAAMDTLIDQWHAALLAHNAALAPLEPPTPDDPETSMPWTHPDRAQEPPLLKAINDLRAAAGLGALSRVGDLDKAALYHLRSLASSGKTTHLGPFGSTPFDRVLTQGYSAAEVYELLAAGPRSAEEVMTRWTNHEPSLDKLMDPAITEAGVAYHYASSHPSAHLWCVVLCVPGPPPVHITPPSGSHEIDDNPDPAKESAKKEADKLDKIKAPTLDPLQPSQLTGVVKNYAEAVQKFGAAEKELNRLMAEKLERDQRIADLERVKSGKEDRVIDVWAAWYWEGFNAGDVVHTAEIPGFWDDANAWKIVTVNEGTEKERDVGFNQRWWNIVRSPKPSQLAPAPPMSPELVFVNTALEPGHLRWRPAWRYGIITALAGNVATVQLVASTERGETDGVLNLNPEADVLTGVPIDYPPCNGLAFAIDDEVLIAFDNQQWDGARIVGFRSAPVDCAQTSWAQL